MGKKGTAETIGPDHPITQVAEALSSQAFELSARMQISRWDLCIAMANACGQILAQAAKQPKPPEGIVMPKRGASLSRDEALGRMDDLRMAMEGGYDLYDVKGSG